MTNAILRGKPDAGNPHVRFDEGEVASAKPRRGSLLYKVRIGVAIGCALAVFSGMCGDSVIWDDRPAQIDNWSSEWYPLGNGELGCMIDGGVKTLRIQFNVDSFWTGDKNLTKDVADEVADANYGKMGEYQNFGELILSCSEGGDGYRRSIDLSRAIYEDSFGGIRRTVFVAERDGANAVFVRIVSRRPIAVRMSLRGTHGEKTTGNGGESLTFGGELVNRLGYAAVAEMKASEDRRTWYVALRARTGFDRRRGDLGLNGCRPSCFKSFAFPNAYDSSLDRHLRIHAERWNRCRLELKGDPVLEALPTRVRLQKVREGARDVALEALMFAYGRYLLIASSAPGSLPANLQGIWCDSNTPAWHSDYHTNINLQMNYWGADVANLFDCFEPLRTGCSSPCLGRPRGRVRRFLRRRAMPIARARMRLAVAAGAGTTQVRLGLPYRSTTIGVSREM